MRTLLLLGLLLGCDGLIGEPSGSEVPPGSISPALCAEAPLMVPPTSTRLLDGEQYTNALRALLENDALSPELDERMGELVTALGAERLHDSLQTIVAEAPLGGCSDDACAKSWLTDLARRAFRREIDADERSLLERIYDDERAHAEYPASVREATQTVAEVILQSPQMLYVVEEGTELDDTSIRRLRGSEVATRLALLLWNSIPDQALLDAAASGELDDPSGIRRQAERMLDDPRARRMVREFFFHWLGLDGSDNQPSLEDAAKDDALYPEMDDALRASMREELGAFVEKIVFEENAGIEALFTDRSAWVDAELAELYGVAAPESGRAWVELDARERSGVLTRAAFSSVYAGARTRSPIRRGVFVLQNVLCRALGEPPPNANDVRVEGGEGDDGVRSLRDDVIARTSASDCTACHEVINPIGFTFENYDAIGRFQTQEVHVVDDVEHVFDLDPSGAIGTGSDVDGSYADAVELSRALSESEQVRDCMATRFYEYAMRRHAEDADVCSLEQLKTSFREGGTFIDLIVGVAQTDVFRHVLPMEVAE